MFSPQDKGKLDEFFCGERCIVQVVVGFDRLIAFLHFRLIWNAAAKNLFPGR